MSDPIREKFVISQKAVPIRDNKCLIMKMTKSSEHWELPGGRIDEGEMFDTSFAREMKEELNFDNFEHLGVVHYETWYIPDGSAVCGIANLIKNDKDEVVISDEHLDMKWVTQDELDDYNFFWPSSKKMIKQGFEKYNLINK